MALEDWINSLKVAELKEELKKRDQPVGGKKAELVERLIAYVREHEVSFMLRKPLDRATEVPTFEK